MYFVKLICCTIVTLFLLSQHAAAQQVICGPALYEILDGICLNGYQAMSLPERKRSELPVIGVKDDQTDVDAFSAPTTGVNSILMDRTYADIANLMAKTRRRRYGIYDECCRKGCTFNELASYCS